MTDSGKVVEKTIIEYFIRVIKEHGHYLTFRCDVSNNGFMGIFIQKQKQLQKPFSSARNVDDLVSVMRELTENAPHHSPNNGDKYENITININHLLYFFLELNGVPIEELCVIGEEIFNLTCNAIYGESFEKNKPKDSIEDMTDIVRIKSKVFQDYVRQLPTS